MMDGKKSLKHVERLTEINKSRNFATCWLYYAIILPYNSAECALKTCPTLEIVSCGSPATLHWRLFWQKCNGSL